MERDVNPERLNEYNQQINKNMAMQHLPMMVLHTVDFQLMGTLAGHVLDGQFNMWPWKTIENLKGIIRTAVMNAPGGAVVSRRDFFITKGDGTHVRREAIIGEVFADGEEPRVLHVHPRATPPGHWAGQAA